MGTRIDPNHVIQLSEEGLADLRAGKLLKIRCGVRLNRYLTLSDPKAVRRAEITAEYEAKLAALDAS